MQDDEHVFKKFRRRRAGSIEPTRRDSNYLTEPDEGNSGTFLTGICRKSYGWKLRIMLFEKYGGPIPLLANIQTHDHTREVYEKT